MSILDGVQDVGTERSFEVALLAQTAVTRRISHFYEALLHNSADTVELYTIGVPIGLQGREIRFGEVIRRIYSTSLERAPDNPVIVVGIHRKTLHRVELNPRRRDHDGLWLSADDQLVVIAYGPPDQTKFGTPPSTLPAAATSYVTPAGVTSATAAIAPHVGGAPVLILADTPVRFHDSDIFDGVQMVPMNPYSPKALERAQVGSAHSVIILADRRLEDPDGQTLLLSLRLNALLKQRRAEATAANLPFVRPNISAEVVDPRNVGYLRQAGKGVDEPICAKEMLYRLFAQAVGNPAMVPVFHELLRASLDTNEVYLEPVPAHLLARKATFAEALDEYARHRSPQNPAIPLGGDPTYPWSSIHGVPTMRPRSTKP